MSNFNRAFCSLAVFVALVLPDFGSGFATIYTLDGITPIGISYEGALYGAAYLWRERRRLRLRFRAAATDDAWGNMDRDDIVQFRSVPRGRVRALHGSNCGPNRGALRFGRVWDDRLGRGV